MSLGVLPKSSQRQSLGRLRGPRPDDAPSDRLKKPMPFIFPSSTAFPKTMNSVAQITDWRSAWRARFTGHYQPQFR
jgi:hypothetical protein